MFDLAKIDAVRFAKEFGGKVDAREVMKIIGDVIMVKQEQSKGFVGDFNGIKVYDSLDALMEGGHQVEPGSKPGSYVLSFKFSDSSGSVSNLKNTMRELYTTALEGVSKRLNSDYVLVAPTIVPGETDFMSSFSMRHLYNISETGVPRDVRMDSIKDGYFKIIGSMYVGYDRYKIAKQ